MSQDTEKITIDPTGDLILHMVHEGGRKTTLLRVCACTMRRASAIWNDELKDSFFTRNPRSALATINYRVRGTDTNDATVSALFQVLHMVHGNHQKVNLSPDLCNLHRTLNFVNKYNLFAVIIPYTVSWGDHCVRLFQNPNVQNCAISAVSVAHIAWHLGLKVEFYEVMTALLRHTYIKDETKISIPSCLPFDTDASLNWYAYSAKYKPMEVRPDDIELPFSGWICGTPSSPADMLSRRRETLVKRILYFVTNEVEPRLANNQTGCRVGNKDCDRQILGNMWARMNDVRGGLLPDSSRSGEVNESITTLVKELDHIFGYTLNNWHYNCSPHNGYDRFRAQILQDLKDWRQYDVTKILEVHYQKTHFQRG